MNGMTSPVRIAFVAALAAASIALADGAARASTSTTPGPSSAISEPYVPFVTDFAKPGPAAAPPQTTSSDWGDFGIAGGVGTALVALLAAWAVLVARRPRLARG